MDSYARGPEAGVRDVTIGTVLRETAQQWPDRVALISRHQNIRLSWADVLDRSRRVAAGLQSLGILEGDRVGVWSTNCAEWVLLQFGCALAGVVLVNVNPAYRSHELSFVLRRSGIRALFLHERDHRADYRAILDESLKQALTPLEHSIYLDTTNWSLFEDEAAPFEPPVIAPDDVANIQYTSGTTGSPKGVLLTHRNLTNNGAFIGQRMRLTESDSICIPVPLYHCFGCVIGTMASIQTGAAMILPAASFDAGRTLEAIAAERATAVYGVPTMFINELQHPEFSRYDLTSLRTGVMAGSPCPVEIMRRVIDEMHCREITIAYGQTETSPVSTMSSADDPIDVRCATVGRVMPETEVKIVDLETRATLPAGQQGELCTRGYLVMKGYDADPHATAKVIDPEGWLQSGDLAVMREDGCFRITGRVKDMILRGGENIYPREIEEFLYTHPKVAEVQVFGIPDDRLGEIVAAWIRLRPGDSGTEHEIRDFCKGKIAYFKVPEVVRFVESFPMTVTGKIQKFRMREIEMERRDLGRAEVVTTA